MNKLLLLLSFLSIHTASAKMIHETVYTYVGKQEQAALRSGFVVSKYYDVTLNKDPKNTAFVYNLRKDIKNEDFNNGIYTATGFTLNPTLSSKLAMSLRPQFKQVGEYKLNGETVSFAGEILLDDTKVGTVNYEFNLYSLKLRRIYNPKVTRDIESIADGFKVMEHREIP